VCAWFSAIENPSAPYQYPEQIDEFEYEAEDKALALVSEPERRVKEAQTGIPESRRIGEPSSLSRFRQTTTAAHVDTRWERTGAVRSAQTVQYRWTMHLGRKANGPLRACNR
jgi:hypothetical protein